MLFIGFFCILKNALGKIVSYILTIINLIFTTFETQFIPMRLFFQLLVFIPLLALGQTSFEKGESFFKSEKYDQAKIQFEKVVSKNPVDLKALEYLGDIQCHLKKWDAAIPYYEKLTTLKPKEADYIYKYGGALGMKAKESNKFKALSLIGDVKNAFEKAIVLNPNHIGARWALIEIYLQLPGIVGGSEKKAMGFSEELLKISPVDGYLAKGHIEEYFNRYAKAEKFYKKAIEIGQSLTTYQKLANLYQYKMNQPEKARQILAIYNEKNKS